VALVFLVGACVGLLLELLIVNAILLWKVTKMSAAMDRLTASVSSVSSAATAAVALLVELKGMIPSGTSAPEDTAALNALSDTLDGVVTTLAEAVSANTPAPT
jgi:hypothetical protein